MTRETTASPSRGPADLVPLDGVDDIASDAPEGGTGRDGGVLDLPPRPAGAGALAWLRWGWRTLTSMRIALVLLGLLALAAVPGSLLPQRSAAGNPAAVRRFIEDNGWLGPVLDRLGFFEVYSAPWFAAIYLLLLVSMTGCVIPRCRLLWRAARSAPTRAPSRLSRMSVYRATEVDGDSADVLDSAARALRGGGFRVRVEPGEIAAEKGYLREVGNLGFHLSLLVLLLGVAVGTLWGYEGRVIVPEGRSFANTVSAYDEIFPGALVDEASLEPFSLTLEEFSARFEPRGPQRGSPRDFTADVTLTTDAGSERRTIKVNSPLQVGLTKVFLTGNGYAPQVTVRDGEGSVVLSGPVVFLPRDGNMTSEGVIKAPDAVPSELGFEGLFLPTAAIDEQRGPFSRFPAPVDPQLLLTAWTGDLGLSSGAPQSVYRLDTSGMDQVMVDGRPFTEALRPGETLTLPDGNGSITFDGVTRFANFQIAADPGRGISLLAAALLLAGLTTSLLVPRRRVWLRAVPVGPGRVAVEAAAQSMTRRPPSPQEIDTLLRSLEPTASPQVPSRTSR